MNTYRCSDGTRIKRSVLDRKIREAKQAKIVSMIEELGYIVCEECYRNDCKPVDCSHDISVKECLETGRAELAYDVNNITMRGRICHKKYDYNYIFKI